MITVWRDPRRCIVKVAVQINLKKHGAALEDFWDGLISASHERILWVPSNGMKTSTSEWGGPPGPAA